MKLEPASEKCALLFIEESHACLALMNFSNRTQTNEFACGRVTVETKTIKAKTWLDHTCQISRVLIVRGYFLES